MAKSKVEKWLTPEGLALLNGWAKDGLTDEQIAKNMKVSTSTYYEYKKKHVEILEALKKGKEVVDYEVENALLKRALGYTTTIEEEKVDKYGNVHTLKKDVHIPADTTAQIFWLKNRKPEKWREKQENINNSEEGVTIIDDLPKSESN